MELLYSPTSPFTRKVMVTAHELGIADRIRLLPVHPRQDVEVVGERNPLAKIPVLTTDSGTILYDSTVICAWLDSEYGQGMLYPETSRKWRVLRDIALANGVLEAASYVRHERLRPSELQSPGAISAEIQRIHRALDSLDAETEPINASIDAGQLALACAVDWLPFRLPDEDWLSRRPRLRTIITNLLARPSLVKTDPRAT